MRKILIVDDDDDLRKLYTQTFLDSKYDVDEATSVNNALDLLGKNSYDIIITDILFPGMDGVYIIKKARSQDSLNINTPIIILTNLDYGEKTKQALKEGANECLFKTKHTAKSIFKEVESILKKDS
ncbi:hypothetical protein A2Z22_01475 [Candidatus Woesebacteria bacterium RBG_16_34_12]|uniref:Response regulatory domain-containing protein n=1 Tax=Candidatus Woesebacteria bacterium RBG_16_34_12 TaxID=1802480 RepID=A0A1F7XA49_9BACT|nr:MAG: hypothetical protein A2Z22_01475 [Candidatus Woesebacteria bacterium RBG_16_34_12]